MTTILLADLSLALFQKTASGLTKLEVLRSLLHNLHPQLFGLREGASLHVFDSSAHLENNLDAFAAFGFFGHGSNAIRRLEPSPVGDLWASFKMVLNFSRFLRQEDLGTSYAGLKTTTEPVHVT
jgi:hypothetical protein